MVIGVDFDNTIVCYDRLFHRVCVERRLIPEETPATKSDVRNYLRAAGREEAWTEMQGYVYGSRMPAAEPYPGVLEFFRRSRDAGVDVYIVSHKTRHPFLGPDYDLHRAATDWLEAQGFYDSVHIGLPRERVHFEVTKEAKLARIAAIRCTHFIDDLPELLEDERFPDGVRQFLFDPNDLYVGTGFERMTSWPALQALLGLAASA